LLIVSDLDPALSARGRRVGNQAQVGIRVLTLLKWPTLLSCFGVHDE
jgi:hypothetical protein